jgi:uncharacterized membrane protein
MRKMGLRWIFCLCLVVLLVVGFLAAPTVAAVETKEAERVDLSLYILSEYRYRDVTPGEDNIVYMEVRNNGDGEVTDIVFEIDAPEGWQVSFDPATIAVMASGSSQTVDIMVVPPAGESRDNYHLTVIAEAAETRAITSFTLNIEDGFSYWLWVGAGLAVLVIIGFIAVYRRFSHQ